MIARIGLLVSNTIGRFIPDPFVLALGLTVLTAILALTIGFPNLLEYTRINFNQVTSNFLEVRLFLYVHLAL